jgi:2-dehydro-3-deoxyphosphooctonate aldolase (KDO 8-P synthase)
VLEKQKGIQLRQITISNNHPFVLIGGPCVIESENHTLLMAKQISEIADKLEVPFIFKSSFDKANRSSIASFRGPGLYEGLRILSKVKREIGVPVLSDIHNEQQIEKAAKVLDIIQIPAFLCRQTDLVTSVAKTGLIVNIKKGQFLAPWDIKEVIQKIESEGCHDILLTERGVNFGYNNLISDMRSLVIMRDLGYPVVFDASHSVQLPGGLGYASGGQSEFISPLARAATAVGIASLYLEIHDNPQGAKCDGPNALDIKLLKKLVAHVKRIDSTIKEFKQES